MDKPETRNSSLQVTGCFGRDGGLLRFSGWREVCLMDGDGILGTDVACTWKEDDSIVGLEYDGRKRCPCMYGCNGGRSSAEMASDSASLSPVPANRAYLLTPPQRLLFIYVSQTFKLGKQYSLYERNAQCWKAREGSFCRLGPAYRRDQKIPRGQPTRLIS